MDAAMMNSKPFSYQRLLGAPYGRLATPAIFIDNLRQHGRTPIDPLPMGDDCGPRSKRNLFDEFSDAHGFQFDWGCVIVSYPPWYFDGELDQRFACRIVPTALWERLQARDQLTLSIPVALSRVRSRVLRVLHPRDTGSVMWELPGLCYELFTPWVDGREYSHELFGWLGSALLPDLLPQTLTYLEALVLDLALRAEVGVSEASERGHHE
jgi:hypothetical protein